jgi:hypothetical protein
MTTRGQVVIPEDMHKRLNLKVGAQFVSSILMRRAFIKIRVDICNVEKNLLDAIMYVVYCSAGGERHENRFVSKLAG